MENHDTMLENLIAVQQRLLANQESLAANQQVLADILTEVRQEADETQRLWLRLAQRYSWLDGEQNGAQPDAPT